MSQEFKDKGMGVDKAEIKVVSMPSMSLKYSNKIEKLQRCKTFQPYLPNCLLNSCRAIDILENNSITDIERGGQYLFTDSKGSLTSDEFCKLSISGD